MVLDSPSSKASSTPLPHNPPLYYTEERGQTKDNWLQAAGLGLGHSVPIQFPPYGMEGEANSTVQQREVLAQSLPAK